MTLIWRVYVKTEPLKEPSPIKVCKQGVDKETQRAGSIRHAVIEKLENKKKIKTGLARKFVYYAEKFSWEVNPILLEIVKNKKPFIPGIKGKHRQFVKSKKKERCPRTYKEYIKSKFWEERKGRFYQNAGRVCAVCGSTSQMSVHHLKYGRFGKEKDEDLVALCWSCYEEFHAIYGVTKDCNKEFAEFCASKVNNVGYLTLS